MKSSAWKGFSVVFRENLKIHMKEKKYVITTLLLGIILILGIGGLILFLTNKNVKKDDLAYNLEQLYIIDQTGIGVPEYAALFEQLGYEELAKTEYIEKTGNPKDVIAENPDKLCLIQKYEDDIYVLELINGENLSMDDQMDKNIEELQEALPMAFKNQVYMSSGLNQGQIIQALLPVVYFVEEIGQVEENKGKETVTIVSVLVFMMTVYFLVIIYGVQICADVPMEKTSKLVEQLLMSVSAYALVSGKILSMVVSCVVQFLFWVVSIILGIVGGDLLAKSIFDLDTSFVSVAIDSLKEWFEGMGFTIPAIIMAILLAVTGLVLYLLLAGLGGAMLSKPEQASDVQTIFMLPLIISYFAILFGTGIFQGRSDFSILFNLIPFTSAMTAPASVLIGNLNIGMALVCWLVMALCCIIIMYLAAKVYEGMLFFNGNKIKAKDVLAVFKKS